jgi:hypothetical protein
MRSISTFLIVVLRGGLFLLSNLNGRNLATAAETSVTFSPTDFESCAATTDHAFIVDNLSGSGTIRDKATDRCLTVKVCTKAYKDVGGAQSCGTACTCGNGDAVVLEDCGKADTCGGGTRQWLAQPVSGAPGTYKFASQAGSKQFCLNAVGDPSTTHMYSLTLWDCGTDFQQERRIWKWDKSTGNFRVGEHLGGGSCDDKLNCCLSALPCTLPCVLPAKWGFLLSISVIIFVYVAAGAAYAIKVQRKHIKTDGLRSMFPHYTQWRSLFGLVKDGALFTSAKLHALKLRYAPYESIPTPIAQTNEDDGTDDDDVVE